MSFCDQFSHDGRRRLCGFGTLGSVGVIGILFGGVFAPRRAACLASASVTNSFVTIGGWAVVVSCLNGLARIGEA